MKKKKFPKKFREDEYDVCDLLLKEFPYRFSLSVPDHDDFQEIRNSYLVRCEELFGPSLYELQPNRKRFYHMRNPDAVWEYWSEDIVFKTKQQCTLFKLACGGNDVINQQF